MCEHLTLRVRAVAFFTVLMWLATLSPVAALQQRPMTVEDVLTVRSVSGATISPDGRWIAYVVSERDFE